MQNLIFWIKLVEKLMIRRVDPSDMDRPNETWPTASDVIAQFIKFLLVHQFLIPSHSINTTIGENLKSDHSNETSRLIAEFGLT